MKRQKIRLVSIKPHESGLECPLCGCKTLNRDNAPAADGWYVEWCSGGVVKYIEVIRDGQGEVVEEIVYEFECPYASAGFKR